MDTTEFDIEFLTQKLSENPQSPLFARLADLYVGKEQAVEALKLCEEGVKLHPHYYAGYIALGKTHLSLKEYSKARSAFERAHDLSPFNRAIADLIAAVPNTPDESLRTTDENYFAPSPEQQNVEQVQSEQPVAVTEETVQPVAEAQFESPTAEEMGFTQSVEEIDASAAAEHLPVATSSDQSFPTFDEYFAQTQSQMTAGPASTLDEYLGGAQPQAQVQNEFIADEPAAAPAVDETAQEHQEPEVVFSSPEQAQLFAEMTGEQSSTEEFPAPSSTIDELAEKLQSAERIVPAENYQTQNPASEESQPYESDMVTPTLAEIYASQGEFNAAIQAYEILMFSQPAKAPEFQRRIQELQQKQMEKDGLI